MIGHKLIPCKNGGILIVYQLDNNTEAKEFFSPLSKDRISKILWRDNFVKQHISANNKMMFNHKANKKIANPQMYAKSLCDTGIIMIPLQITHRLNDKKKSIIHRKVFKE